MKDLLVEIGCENLPPDAIKPAFEDLKKRAARRLDELRLAYRDIYTTGSPRRIVLIVCGLAARQASKTETVTGPPESKAFDDKGNLSKAGAGFARSRGIDPKKLKTVQTDKGAFLGFTHRLKTQPTPTILKELVPELIGGLKFPKMMRWEPTGHRFARPIRWIVCLFGETVVRFDVAGVRSGNVSYTVPWIRREAIRVGSAELYVKALRKAGVEIDHAKRNQAIKAAVERAAKKAGLVPVRDEALFAELTFMLETPKVLMGEFDRGYLKLPAEVVVTAMKAHQRYVAFKDKKGRLVPRFLTFTEGKVGSPVTVRHGNEKVLKARLEDALFYWHEDLKNGMNGLAEKLGAIVFIEGLGSLKDKSDRVRELCLLINGMMTPDKQTDAAKITRAAAIAKADLASEMIKDGKEFTLLQGLIGSHYGREGGEDGDVVTGLGEQYLPRSPSDPLPSSVLGTLLSLADRIDTITGCFIADLTPTGSQDPYALRRQANGLLRMIEQNPGVSIEVLIDAAVGAYADAGFLGAVGKDAGAIGDALGGFFRRRVETYLREGGVDYDIAAAVTAVVWPLPGVAQRRARVIQDLRGDGPFELLITGAKRVGNILDDGHKIFGLGWEALHEAFLGGGRLSADVHIDPARFVDDAEKALYQRIGKVLPRLEASSRDLDEVAILKTLSELGPTIDNYFDEVLVNSPDAELRSLRHQFLASVFAMFAKYADLSHIVEQGEMAVG